MKKTKRKHCVYCAATGQLTRDHIPPRGLFATPPRGGFLTVPACRRCNETASKDDEYFRTTLAMREDVFDDPAIQGLMPTIARSFENPRAPGMRRAIAKSSLIVDAFSKGGIYLGKKPAMRVDLNRLNRVASRIVKALFYHFHDDTKLPSNYRAHAHQIDSFKAMPNEEADRCLATCQQVLENSPLYLFGEWVMACWWLPTDLDPLSTIWILVFFRRVLFIGMTTPAVDVPPGAEPMTA